MRRVLAVLGAGVLATALGVFAVVALAGDRIEGPNGEQQVVVCKYVGTPGVDERLQTGNNPITPDANSLPGFTGVFPWEFADAHGRSIAIRWAADSHDGDISECPAPQGPVEVTALAPGFQDPTCELGARVDLPAVAGLTYTVLGTVAPGQTVKVKVTADEGYVLVGVDEWEHTFGNVPDNCGPPPPAAIEVTPGVTFQDPTCDVGAAVNPTTVTGLTYRIEGDVAPGEKVTVTASANDGYTIRGNNTWEHTFGLVPSNCATPPLTVTTPTTPTEPTLPTAPLQPPTTPKPAVERPVQPKPAPLAPPKQAVAGGGKQAVAPAQAKAQPRLAFTP